LLEIKTQKQRILSARQNLLLQKGAEAQGHSKPRSRKSVFLLLMQWVLPLYQNWSSSSSQSAHSWLKFDTGPEEGLVFAVWQASLADKWGFLNPEEQLGAYTLNHSTSLFGMGFF
jgi:hypothetical protein